MVALITTQQQQPMYISQPLQQLTNKNMLVDEHDEEDSTSSTIPISSCLILDSKQQPFTQQQEQQPSSGCRVRFADTVTYHANTNDDEYTDTDDAWYTAEDYHFFRHSTLQFAQQVIDTEHRNRAPHSYQRVLERIYARHCCQTTTMPAQELLHLQRWATAAPQRWGLEKWCIRIIAHDKSRRRKATVASVVTTARNVTTADDAATTAIRCASLQWSQASVQLGHILALGLAGSLEREDGHQRL